MPTYFLVQSGDTMPRWSRLGRTEDGAEFWIDFRGRRTPVEAGKPLAHVDGENDAATIRDVPEDVARLEREMAFRYLLNPWSNQGWISPEGRFYGCSFFGHDDIAHALLRKGVGELEWQGWIRVHDDSYVVGETKYGQKATARQEATLAALGFDPDNRWSHKRSFAVDLDGPPPRYAVKMPEDLAMRIEAERRMHTSSAPQEGSKTPLSVEAGMERLVPLFGADPALAAKFDRYVEMIPDVGPGEWLWMMRFDGMDIGSPEHPAEILGAPGIHLRATSFDTLEASPWHAEGLHIDAACRRVIVGPGHAPGH